MKFYPVNLNGNNRIMYNVFNEEFWGGGGLEREEVRGVKTEATRLHWIIVQQEFHNILLPIQNVQLANHEK